MLHSLLIQRNTCPRCPESNGLITIGKFRCVCQDYNVVIFVGVFDTSFCLHLFSCRCIRIFSEFLIHSLQIHLLKAVLFTKNVNEFLSLKTIQISGDSFSLRSTINGFVHIAQIYLVIILQLLLFRYSQFGVIRNDGLQRKVSFEALLILCNALGGQLHLTDA